MRKELADTSHLRKSSQRKPAHLRDAIAAQTHRDPKDMS
jgi:hypothetical protein